MKDFYEKVGDTYITTKRIRVVNSYNLPNIKNKYIEISKNEIIVEEGTPWNGSNFSEDTDNCMFPSLIHDQICAFINNSKLSKKIKKIYRKLADICYRKMCIEEGMKKIRAWNRYLFIRKFVHIKYLL